MKYIGFIYGDFCMLQTFLSTIIEFFSFIESLCFLVFFAVVILKPPIAVTVLNFYYLIKIPKEERAKKISLISAILTITVGLFDTYFYLGVCCDVTSADWNKPIYNFQLHTPISSEHLPVIIVLAVFSVIAYFILYAVKVDKTPPLVTVILIAFVYIGMILAILWTIQITSLDLIDFFILAVYPFNLVLIGVGLIRQKLIEYKEFIEENGLRNEKLGKLGGKLADVSKMPLYAFLFIFPIIGIVICILLLFGQRPDSIIKAWTETSDWTFSMRQAPPNVYRDEHYLCTVAAGGHKEVVKPQREGVRHGHRVLVNRQLCVANAFEQLLEDKTPRFHRAVRRFYDKYGFPAAKLIKTSFTADIVYIIMKPLEWIFLAILYMSDADPERRIAVQYLPEKDRESLLYAIDSGVKVK